MNQRASHFNFGSNPQNYGSVYGKDYGPKYADPNQHKGNNPFRSSSLNMGEKGNFATTNKMLYRAWDNAERAKLDDQKLHQLKSHHFKLGSYNPNQVFTTNKIYHDRKAITGQASKTQQESKNKMRAHYHDFKEQNYTNYKSSYANQFTSKEGDYSGKVGTSHPDNAIVFGNHQLPMNTTSNASYTPKTIPGNVKQYNEPTLGIKLGDDKSQPMETLNQHYFNRKQIVKTSLPESTMKQLRNTHFNLGLMPQQYQTQNDHYKTTQAKAQANTNKLTYQIPVYETGGWVDKEAKFNGSTTNQRQLPNREVKAFERAVQVTREGIDLGSHNNSYQTQFKNKFTTPNQWTKVNVDINRKSNVVIGSDVGYYTTEHKSSYKNNDISEAKIKIDFKQLSKEDHFKIGGSSIEPKVTIYQDEHRKDHQNRNKVFHK